METTKEKKFGWEVARDIEAERPTMTARAKLSSQQIRIMIYYSGAFIVLFLAAVWLASNPFAWTQRIPSEFVQNMGWIGTNNWMLVWWVILIAAIFEYMDSAGGMGYGTALTPLLLMAGFDPKQVVPCIMITEMFTGLIAGVIHGEFGNVEWKLRPMNETTRLVIVVAITGMVFSAISITAVYKIFLVHKFWIKLYVAMLLIVMGICSLLTAKTFVNYRPGWMWLFASLGGFNKGIGGGGYGPVITVGGLLSGVPVKSMVAVTSLAEGATCLVSVITWFAIGTSGITVDYLLMPSLVIGTVIAAIGAPYTTRILPEKFWKVAVPVYCCLLAIYSFYKLWPDIQKRLLS